MAYKLHELKKQIPGIAGDKPSKPVPPLGPRLARELRLDLDAAEGLTVESDAAMPLRALMARSELAKLDREQEAHRAQKISETLLPALIEQDIQPEA